MNGFWTVAEISENCFFRLTSNNMVTFLLTSILPSPQNSANLFRSLIQGLYIHLLLFQGAHTSKRFFHLFNFTENKAGYLAFFF